MGSDRRAAHRVCLTLTALATAAAVAPFRPAEVRGQETVQANVERLSKMSADEKATLSKKKQRFDELPPTEKERLRELHVSITGDPQASELTETVKRYHRWLMTLESAQRVAVLDEKDSQKRIAKIKELLQAQEERRFREFVRDFADNLRKADQDKFFDWFGDFVERHKDQIVKRMPDDVRRRYKEEDDSKRRRDRLMRSWSFQYSESEAETPLPTTEDIDRLMTTLSEEARKPFAVPEQRPARVIVFMRAAGFSLLMPQVSREELKKFYASMKADDPRRQRLKNLDDEDELMAELRRMWAGERFRDERGHIIIKRGPGGGPPGGRNDGRDRDRDRDGNRRPD